MLIEILSNAKWSLTNPVANYSTNGYPTRVNTITKPSGDGVIPFGDGGGLAPQWLKLMPIGVGSDNNTFTMKVLLWTPTFLNVGTPLWIPQVLAEWTCTLSASVGIANSDLGTTTRFADTITMTGGPTLITNAAAPTALTAAPIVEKWFQTSPTGDQNAMVIVPTFGARLVEVIFSTGGVATSCNALYTKL